MKQIGTALLLLLHGVCFAQNKPISGIVKDGSDGSGLPGVTVTVQGNPAGAATDLNGEFQIEAAVGDTLVFTLIGKTTVKQAVGERNILVIVMYNDVSLLIV